MPSSRQPQWYRSDWPPAVELCTAVDAFSGRMSLECLCFDTNMFLIFFVKNNCILILSLSKANPCWAAVITNSSDHDSSSNSVWSVSGICEKDGIDLAHFTARNSSFAADSNNASPSKLNSSESASGDLLLCGVVGGGRSTTTWMSSAELVTSSSLASRMAPVAAAWCGLSVFTVSFVGANADGVRVCWSVEERVGEVAAGIRTLLLLFPNGGKFDECGGPLGMGMKADGWWWCWAAKNIPFPNGSKILAEPAAWWSEGKYLFGSRCEAVRLEGSKGGKGLPPVGMCIEEMGNKKAPVEWWEWWWWTDDGILLCVEYKSMGKAPSISVPLGFTMLDRGARSCWTAEIYKSKPELSILLEINQIKLNTNLTKSFILKLTNWNRNKQFNY